MQYCPKVLWKEVVRKGFATHHRHAAAGLSIAVAWSTHVVTRHHRIALPKLSSVTSLFVVRPEYHPLLAADFKCKTFSHLWVHNLSDPSCLKAAFIHNSPMIMTWSTPCSSSLLVISSSLTALIVINYFSLTTTSVLFLDL